MIPGNITPAFPPLDHQLELSSNAHPNLWGALSPVAQSLSPLTSNWLASVIHFTCLLSKGIWVHPFCTKPTLTEEPLIYIRLREYVGDWCKSITKTGKVTQFWCTDIYKDTLVFQTAMICYKNYARMMIGHGRVVEKSKGRETKQESLMESIRHATCQT